MYVKNCYNNPFTPLCHQRCWSELNRRNHSWHTYKIRSGLLFVALDPSLDTILNHANVGWLWNLNICHLQKKFSATEIKITTDGKHHLGATIGSTKYRDQYITEKIDNLCKELHLLSEIGKIKPQAVYAGFTSGFGLKLTFIMRTIPDISIHLRRID